MALYHALLHLLPKDRRRHDGAEMAAVFADLTAERRGAAGRLAVGRLWIAEAAGLLRFALRERAARIIRALGSLMDAASRDGGPGLGRELRWAWRGLVSRGWRGVLVVSLLALAMAANAIVFASADSFVFNRVPYRDATRLVEIGEQRRYGWQASVWPELVSVWRKQTDLFADFQAYNGGQVYLSGGDDPRFAAAESLTPGLVEMLGARPAWGRSFTNADLGPGAEPVVLLAEEVAVKEFGDARQAVGRMLSLGDKSARVVGVMPAAFRFPSGAERVWLPLDLSTVRTRSLIQPIARMASGASLATFSPAVGNRAPALAVFVKPENGPPSTSPKTEARPIAASLVNPKLRRLFVLLAAAAGCVLLIACANVANLELGTAAARTREHAISLALGASRGTLIRTALLEGAMVVAAAAAIATGLTWQATTFIAAHLPTATTAALPNRIDVDPRTLVFMAGVGALAWVLASLPVGIAASRADVIDALKIDARTASASRGGIKVRHVLTSTEVALTVLLLVGAWLSVRTYTNLLALPDGFDPTSIVTVALRQKPNPSDSNAVVQERVLSALRARPDVLGAAIASAAPPEMGGSIAGDLTIEAETTPRGFATVAGIDVGTDYFRTLGLSILSGRDFQPGDVTGSVIVDEAFARKYWPNGQAIGGRFHIGGASFGGKPEMTVIGITRHLRTNRDSITQPSDVFFPVYIPLAQHDRYVPLSFVVHLRDPATADSVLGMVRAEAPGARVRLDRMTDRYAATFADEQLASSIMSAFGVLAFVVATAGVYGVMAFFVATRTREIGIRMALGADRQAVRRLILTSSLTPVLVGASLGMMAAVAAAEWARSLYFEVGATAPSVLIVVGLIVVLTAALATWQPARLASRIDPSRLLRE